MLHRQTEIRKEGVACLLLGDSYDLLSCPCDLRNYVETFHSKGAGCSSFTACKASKIGKARPRIAEQLQVLKLFWKSYGTFYSCVEEI